MEYLYYIANTSLTLRVVDYLRTAHHLPLQFITVIHQIDGWVVKVKMSQYLTPEMHGDFRAFMNELGFLTILKFGCKWHFGVWKRDGRP